MPRWIVLVIGVVVTAAFGGAAVRAQGPADLKTFDFMLGDVQYRILLPQSAKLMGWRVSDRFHVSLSTRMIRQLEVSLASGQEAKTFPKTRTLPNGAVFRFEINSEPEGPTGSGGPETSLEGRLQIGERMLAIKCHDQASWPGAPWAGWCIDYLHHLAVVPSG
jgi:hypothetical protein